MIAIEAKRIAYVPQIQIPSAKEVVQKFYSKQKIIRRKARILKQRSINFVQTMNILATEKSDHNQFDQNGEEINQDPKIEFDREFFHPSKLKGNREIVLYFGDPNRDDFKDPDINLPKD